MLRHIGLRRGIGVLSHGNSNKSQQEHEHGANDGQHDRNQGHNRFYGVFGLVLRMVGRCGHGVSFSECGSISSDFTYKYASSHHLGIKASAAQHFQHVGHMGVPTGLHHQFDFDILC